MIGCECEHESHFENVAETTPPVSPVAHSYAAVIPDSELVEVKAGQWKGMVCKACAATHLKEYTDA